MVGTLSSLPGAHVPAPSPATVAASRGDAARGLGFALMQPAKLLALREVSAMRLAMIVSRISSILQGAFPLVPSHLGPLCSALGRAIDYSISVGEVYDSSCELLSLIKQIYKFRNEPSLQVAIMLLLIAIKNACQEGWFDIADRNELITMANEMMEVFTFGSSRTEESQVLVLISTIIPKFYPQLEFGSYLVSLEAKTGYDILVADFFIPRDKPPHQGIMLFVVQKDNMETSSCLISPPHVNFLVNGRGIVRRTTAYVDVGPQWPTEISHMLKFGTNLLQAVGYFDGNYIIVVAFASKKMSSGIPMLQDYMQPVAATVAQDAEIIEGPSKISLNCPISFKRIKTPVKGHNCKHHQCFDYENFITMNAMKPSWRCPHCNQPVSCLDIRIDKSMVKILAETRENGTHVVISADGSWKVVDDHGGADKHVAPTGSGDDQIVCERDEPLHSSLDIVDLTMEEDIPVGVGLNLKQVEELNSLLNQSATGNTLGTCNSEERKPLPENFHGSSLSDFTSEDMPEPCGQVRDELWSRISLAAISASQPHTQTVRAALHAHNPSSRSVVTDAISAVLNCENTDLRPTSTTQSSIQAQQFLDNWQLQQNFLGNSIINNDYERQTIPRQVNRMPTAILALPVHPQMPSLCHRPHTSALNLTTAPSVSVHASPSMLVNQAEVSSEVTRQQVLRMPNLPSSSIQLQSAFQSREVQSSQYHPNAVSQHIMGIPPQNPANVTSLTTHPRVGSFAAQPPTGGQTSLLQHQSIWTQHMMSMMNQAVGVSSQPSRFSSAPLQRATQNAANLISGAAVNCSPAITAQQSAQAARFQAMQAPRNLRSLPIGDNCRVPGAREGTSEAPGGFSDASAEQSWRPTGRMRGSLTGSAYAAALSNYMLQPTQQVAQAAAATTAANRSEAGASEYYATPPIGTDVNESLIEQPVLTNVDVGNSQRV